MTTLAEAESRFGRTVRSVGGAIFGIERCPSIGSRYEEKLQIGTPDGFIKIAVGLNQPNIDAVLCERIADLIQRAAAMRTPSRPTLASSFGREASAGKR
jgi:hypothetical protein